ncbi:spermidine synthase [Hoeflea ulvae]|uniref:Spermidine synthase n=1 Tax=Hoeflea ulvae TaxID=2983764 RepID=A0ABT3YJJ8_9HYPH|nr:spermidine synthase [Hoeflea ulvae]MCY0095997.1 spermidine synthase [Hoeflea ulvae]
MSRLFEELDYRPTPIGALVLRRRREARLGIDILEIKLGEEHLMSDLFTASEIALADLGLSACKGEGLDVVVGGLGLGFTAKAALDQPRTGSLIVVEYLEAVIDWHRTGLLPLGPDLTGDPRCRLVEGDFFAMARGDGFDPEVPGRLFDAILLDIDHSPDALLDARSESFYQPEGLEKLAAHLKPGGIFGLWSDALTDDSFTARLASVFSEAWAEPVTFHNPLQDKPFTQTVYLGRKG